MNQLQIRNKHKLNKYAYVINNPWEVRFLYLLGIAAWLLLLYGYFKFFIATGNKAYFYIFGPFLALVTIYHLTTYFIKLFIKKFDTKKHESFIANYWQSPQPKPTVDIFLPVCNEPANIILETFDAVKKIDYTNKTVYVLDDGTDPNIKTYALDRGFVYLSRPNKGEVKKAGNLKYGYEHSNGEFIVIFDSDFKPEPTFIKELLPYMQDSKIGIVQSPQYFAVNDNLNKLSPLGYGAGHMQQDFYRVMLQARDSFNAIICVGTNAIYRRKALDAMGGPAQYDHSEDVHTGLGMIKNGYNLKYIPVIQAVGLCPEDSVSFFKQHNRWCSGSVGLFMTGKVFRCNLNPVQIINYYTGFLYFLSQCVYFILPAQMYYLLFYNFNTISVHNAIYFIPHIIFGMIIVPHSRPSPLRLGTYIANISAIYIHTITVILRFFGIAANWVPTNLKNIKIDPIFVTIHIASVLYVAFYIFAAFYTSFVFRLPVLNFNYYTLLFWIYWNIFYHSLFALSSGFVIYKKQLAKLFEEFKVNNVNESGIEHPLFAYRYILFFPVVVLIVLTIVSSKNNSIFNTVLAQQQAESRSIAAQVSITPAIAKQAQPKGQVAGAKSQYVYIAKPGDTLTKLASQATANYASDNNLTLLNYQKNYIVTQLVEQQQTKTVQVNDQVTFKSQNIETLLETAKKMPQFEINYWDKASTGDL